MSRRGLLCLVALLAGCRGRGDGEATSSAAVAVRMAEVVQRAFPQTVVAIGTVTPRPGRFAALSAPAPARVARILVAPGQRVRAGDTLIAFERAPFEAAARSADAALNAAQAAHERAVRLAQAGVLPRKDVDQAAAELARAQSEEVTARRALELAALRAPLAGVVTLLNAVMGQSVDANQVLVEVADPDALDIVLAVSAADAAGIRPGAEVTLSAGTDSRGPSLGTAVVTGVAAALDSVSRAVAVRARVTHPARTLRIGETMTGRITTGVHPGALAVPSEALVPDGDAFRVFVVDADGVVHARAVTVGARADSLVEILDGLRAGETVVTYGAYGLEDSVKVSRSRP